MTEDRRARSSDKRELVAFIVGFLLIIIGGLKIMDEQDALKREATQLGTQYQFAIEACIRLQIVRIEDNVSHYADYKVFTTVLRLSEMNLKRGRVPRSRIGDELTFLKPLAEAVKAKTWVPPTDCTRVVNRRGIHYKPPEPVPFYRQLPPPSELTLPRGDFR